MEEETRQVIFETNGKTYWELYVELVETRRRNPIPDGVPFEIHHIRPKSIFPELANDLSNLIRLTPKEHVRAHFLLWQHYKLETDDKNSENSMCYAFWMMVHEIRWNGCAELSWIEDEFEELRLDMSKLAKNVIGEKWKDPEYRKIMSDAAREAWGRPGRKEMLVEKNPMNDPDTRKKISESVKMAWKDPERRAKRMKALKIACKNPERRRKLSESLKTALKDPKRRAKRSSAMKERWKDPEYRKSMEDMSRRIWNDPVRKAEWSGGNNPFAKRVVQCSVGGTFVAEYPSLSEAAEKTSSKRAGISACCAGKRKTHNGFVWKYAESK